MNSAFRMISFRGFSFLLLLFFAMPMKYMAGQEIFVKLLGMPHGILFLLYVAMALFISSKQKWDFQITLEVIFASVIPFATFYIDRKYLRQI